MTEKRFVVFAQTVSIVLLSSILAITAGIRPALAQDSEPQEGPIPQDICTSTLRIMPLGDSITKGSGSEVLDDLKMVSYRKDLWNSLKASGRQVDFVGSQTNGSFYSGFDPDHEGHGGWPAEDIRDNIYGSGGNWLQNTPADIILLHIGTNDLNNGEAPQVAVTEVSQILDKIDLYENDTGKHVVVLLARIIRRVGDNSAWIDFNNKLQKMADVRIAAGDDLIVVNQETGAGLIYAVQPAGDMYDNGSNILHPYHTGYTKMAAKWNQAIESLYQGCNQAPVVTNPGAQTSQEGARVSLKIQANDPEGSQLTYKAQDLPPGLSINPSTGLISGTIGLTAAQGSPYQVKVTVSDSGNPSRSSQASFSWTVLAQQEIFLPMNLFRAP